MINSNYIFLVFFSAVSLFISFMEGSVFPPLVFIYPIILYHMACSTESIGVLVKKIFILSTIVLSTSMYWLSLPLNEVGGIPVFLAFCIVILFAAILSIYPICFSLMSWYIHRNSELLIIRILLLGLFWIILEYLQTVLFTGFPWYTIVVPLVKWTPLVYPVAIFGSVVYSGILLSICLFLYEYVYNKERQALVACSFVILIVLYSAYIVHGRKIENGIPLQIALIQGNIIQSDKWRENLYEETIDKYVALTKQALEVEDKSLRDIDFVIWPETAIPFILDSSNEFVRKVSQFVLDESITLLTGSLRYGGTTIKNKPIIYNSAQIITPNGEISSWYDKEHLVPFGEYTPFPFNYFLSSTSIQLGGAFTEGQNRSLLSAYGISYATLICYEILFPDLIKKQIEEGAGFIVNISNDAWFGNTGAAWQHLQHARIRAIEQSRYLVRATNTGISAVISPKGEIIKMTKKFEDAFIVEQIYVQTTQTPFYLMSKYMVYIICFSLLILFYIKKIYDTGKNTKKKLIRRKI
ncbi:MAG: apolipoprotein N-acyltransferase [Desulfovibrionaceae bacterium]